MINLESLKAVAASRINKNIGKPLYDSYCFSQIPPTIYHLLTRQGDRGLPNTVLQGLPQHYDKVVLVLIDAFGWCFFEEYKEQFPFLKRFIQEGIVSKLTTQFPSTTAAHVTTIHTGLPVGKSGVYEWFYYEPKIDNIMASLLFSFAGDKERESLQKIGIEPKTLFPTSTFYQKLQKQGIPSFCFQHQNYAFSSFSQVVCEGSTIVPYRTIPEGLVNLTQRVINQEGKGYFYFYLDPVDAIAHKYGPHSRQLKAEIKTLLTTLETLLHQSLAGKVSNTLLLVTADHGQIEVSSETNIYLNQLLPDIKDLMQTNQQGKPLVPAGSSRDMFLHIRPQFLEDAYDLLTHPLQGHATIYRTQTLIEEGFFGTDSLSSTFLNRLGNLVILPHKHKTVWWYEKDRFEQKNLGFHGGLSPEEMETILLALSL